MYQRAVIGPARTESEAVMVEAGRMGVADEFAQLNAVLVGSIRDAVVPRYWPTMEGYLAPDVIDSWKANEGRPVAEAFGGVVQRAIEQADALAATLADQGVDVVRPDTSVADRAHLAGTLGFSAQFPRDPWLVIDHWVIETQPQLPPRRREAWAYRDGVGQRLAPDAHAVHVGMPAIPVDGTGPAGVGAGAYLEGGDVFVLGETILVGRSGMASNDAGIEWLRRLVGDAHDVVAVPLAPQWLHLDCVFAVIRPGLAMADRSAFLEGLPDAIADWEVIDVSPQEAHAMGCNTLCLAPGRVIMDASHPRLADELAARDVEVIAVPYDAPVFMGGGIRCSTHPLSRG